MKKTMITVAAAFIVMGTMVASVEEGRTPLFALAVFIAPVALGRAAAICDTFWE